MMKSLLQLRLNIIIFLFLLNVLFPLFYSQPPLNNNYKEPYLSVIFTGQGNKEIVSQFSKIVSDNAFLTSSHKAFRINMNNNRYVININNKIYRNNITMEFSKGDNNLQYLFHGLNHIIKVDLSHYNIKVKDTSYMFYNCKSLNEIIFGNFDISEVTSMAGMFQGTSVISLDLSNFKSTNVKDINCMFNSCYNLKYLNMENFDYSKITSYNNMFDGCQNSLIYLNIYSIDDTRYNHFNSDLLNKINNNNFIICINETKAPRFMDLIIKKNFTLDCSYIPKNDINSIDTIETIIELGTNIPTPTPTKESYQIEEKCSSEDFFKGKCGKDNGNENENENKEITVENKDKMINNIVEDIVNGNLDNILDSITSGEKEDFIIQEDDILYQLTTSDNQVSNQYNNISSINLGKCEDILKEIYNISNTSSLIILKVDYFMDDFKIPIIGYEVFHPETKIKLNLGYCNNVTVDYNIPVDINEEELDKYNISSDYYNDECSIYTTEDGTDIIILDRKKEFNDNKMFLCENNCNYTNYNSTTKKSVCMCGVKSKIYSISEIINNKESISQNFNISDTSTSSSNLNLMKCIDTLFSKYGLLKNLEFYILITMSVLYVISGIFYYRIGSNLIEGDIQEILDIKYKNERKFKRARKSKSKTTRSKSNKSLPLNPDIFISNPKKKRKSISKIKVSSNSITKKVINIEQQKSISDVKINNIIENQKEAIIDQKDMTDHEINTLDYKEALIYDKRDLIQYYISLLKTKPPIIFSFVPIKDYNSIIIKMDLFILKFAICSAINALFFTESTIHRIYADKGTYNLGFYLPKIIISFLITHIIIIGLKYLFLSEPGILRIKKKTTYSEASGESDKFKRCLMIKYILFYILGTAFLHLFWFYLSSFCAVYQNTQIFLIINTFVSLLISFIYPIIINFLPAFLRNYSLTDENHQCIYKASKIIQII